MLSFFFDFLFPQSTTKGALQIIQERLQRDFQKKPILTPIEALESRVQETVASSVGQKNFFHNREETADQINALLGRLSEIHGKEQVFHAKLTQDRRPEKSWVKTILPEASLDIADQIPERPSYLIKPERVEIYQNTLYIREKRYPIAFINPEVERISGDWQFSPETGLNMGFDRDYFIVNLQDKRRLLLFKTEHDELYLHGYYG